MYSMYRSYMTRQERSEINVKGVGTEFTVPDVAIVSIDIVTTGEDPLEIELFNSNRVGQVLRWLNQFGIQDKDINVQDEILTPLLDEEGKTTSYQASTFITVTFYDFASISEFYYNIRGTDIEYSQITLTIKDVDKYYYIALKNAVDSAYQKAEVIADNMNVKLLPTPVILTETSNIEDILDQIIITEIEDVEKSGISTIVISATVEAKFLVEDIIQ